MPSALVSDPLGKRGDIVVASLDPVPPDALAVQNGPRSLAGCPSLAGAEVAKPSGQRWRPVPAHRRRLEADRDAVEARVRRAFQRTVVAMEADHLGAALEAPHEGMRRRPIARRGVAGDPLVTTLLEVGNRLRVERVLEGDVVSLEDPVARGVTPVLPATTPAPKTSEMLVISETALPAASTTHR